MKITVKNLTKSFGNEQVLRGLDLVLPSGSKMALVGANGSGKSTLLRALMGMISYGGEILFTQEGVTSSFSVKEKIAYVPQISPYFSSRVRDIVSTVLSLRGIGLEDLRGCLQQLNLEYDAIAHLPFRKLSGGMKQKLLIALAFAARPQVLFLDEPTSSLDLPSRESFYRLCQESQRSQGVSLFLCSHRLEEIHNLVDEVVVLDKGVITYKGDTSAYMRRVLK